MQVEMLLEASAKNDEAFAEFSVIREEEVRAMAVYPRTPSFTEA